MEKLKNVIVFIVLWIFAYLVTFDMPKTDRQYQDEGIQVYATITNVMHNIRGRGNSYQCEYVNAEGKNVTAQLILNQINGEVGQVVEGYYLAETPGKVYCPPSKLLRYGLIIMVDGLAIMVTIAVFSK